uniref:Cytochrome P450C11 n=1 Tax=Varanus komodoensis TaxID=61221 RepID=A0A8D2IRD7_VARKO
HPPAQPPPQIFSGPLAPGCRKLAQRLGPGCGRRGIPPAASKVLPFEAIPHSGHNAWINLFQFWRSNSFQNLHHVMQRNFQNLGPIYREKLGTHDSINVFLPHDAAQLFRAEGTLPRRMGIDAWTAHRELNGEKWLSDRLILNKEVISLMGARKFLPFLDTVAEDFVDFLHRQIRKNSRGSLTVDLYHDLFRFTLEGNYVLYGERLGLLEERPRPESQQFIEAVETMLKTTLPLLFIPPGVMRWVHRGLWLDHVAAWDAIFKHADRCIQNIYQEFCVAQPCKYSGIMSELLLQEEMSLDCIKANMIELTAGGVETTAMPLLFTLFELARNPQVQAAVREEIRRADALGPQELSKVLSGLPLLKGAIKETLSARGWLGWPPASRAEGAPGCSALAHAAPAAQRARLRGVCLAPGALFRPPPTPGTADWETAQRETGGRACPPQCLF